MNYLEKIKQLYGLVESRAVHGFLLEEIEALEDHLKIKLSHTLKEYYLTLGGNEAINYSHNRLLKPDKEVGFSDDNYLMFYEECQAVVNWGIKEQDLNQDNPPVWANYGTIELPDWELQFDELENFLLFMAVYNGTLGGLKYHANSFEKIKPEVVEKVETNWEEVIEIRADRSKTFTNNFDEIITINYDLEGNGTSAFIGTNSKEKFDVIIKSLEIDWSYISYEDEDLE